MKNIALDETFTQAIAAPTVQLELAQPAAAAEPEILSTPAVRLVLNRIAYAVKRGSPLCVVAGEHGAGKTTAARLYARNSARAFYWQVPPEYNAREVVADLCRHLNINAGEAWRTRTSVLIAHLQDHPYVILLDEAQRLDYKAMDMLKYIADNANVTIVMLGSPWLDRMVDRHSDISSRAEVRVRVQAIDLQSLTTLYTPKGYQPKTLKAVHDVTRGIMRSINALLEHLDEGLSARPDMSRADLTPEHVKAVAEEVLS